MRIAARFGSRAHCRGFRIGLVGRGARPRQGNRRPRVTADRKRIAHTADQGDGGGDLDRGLHDGIAGHFAVDSIDLVLVERVVLQNGAGKVVELRAMLGQESDGIRIALVRNPLDLGVYLAGGGLAVGSRQSEPGAAAIVGKRQGPDLW